MSSGTPGGLSSAYSFRVTPDSVISDLPYFGSSRFPTSNFSQSPLSFVSTKFDYALNPTAKGGWDVIIRFKDVQEVQGISLSILKDGYGTLQVAPTHVQSISFSGSIERK